MQRAHNEAQSKPPVLEQQEEGPTFAVDPEDRRERMGRGEVWEFGLSLGTSTLWYPLVIEHSYVKSQFFLGNLWKITILSGKTHELSTGPWLQ